jgi:hypothetical protein
MTQDVSRKLTTIERALVAETPALAARFALFNRLAEVEGPVTAEPVADDDLPRPRPRPAHLAALLLLGAVVALCITLSIRTSPVPHQCLASAAVGSASDSSVRALTCPTFANR